jgi:hypothetical protein
LEGEIEKKNEKESKKINRVIPCQSTKLAIRVMSCWKMKLKKNQLKKNKKKLMVFFNCFPTNDAN